MVHDLLRKINVFPGIDYVQTISQNSYGPPPVLKGRPMGHPIDAPGQATDYSDVIPGQFGGQASRGFSSI